MEQGPDTIWSRLLGTDFQVYRLQVDGVSTRCLEAGSGPPLLLLHGGGGHIEAYARNIGPLATRFHVYAVDLIGHGFSDRPEVGDFSFQKLTDYIGALIDALGHDQVNIAALSISAMASAVYAGTHPEKVSRLLLNTGVPLQADAAGRERWTTSIAQRRRISGVGSWSREDVRQRLGRVFFGGADTVPEELVDVRYRIYAQPDFTVYNNELIEDLLLEIIGDNEFTASVGPSALKAIRCPTTLLWTTVNPGQGIEVAKEALSLLSDGRLVVFDRSGHWPQWEQDEDFNILCFDFFGAPS